MPANTSNSSAPSSASTTVNRGGETYPAGENASNNISRDQPTPTNLDDHLRNMSVDEHRRWQEISTGQPNSTTNPSHPQDTAPATSNVGPQSHSRQTTGDAAAFQYPVAQGNSGARTVNGEGYRGNPPPSINIFPYLEDWSPEERAQLNEATSSRNVEPSANMAEFWTFSTDSFDPFHTDSSATPQAAAAENPAVSLSDLLPEEDPATQEQWQNAWATAISEHASHPRRHLNTPLLARDGAENGNAPSLDDLPVHVSNLRLGTPTEERLAALAQFSDYPEDDASNDAPGEDSTASSQRDATTLTRRRNRGAARRGTLTRTTSEANRAFWHQFSDSENDR